MSETPPPDRFLRSTKLRQALYYAADGKCQICGDELPDDWHADHIEPWARTHRTNVHEMQALCPKCNLRKGESFMSSRTPRRHQAEMMAVCQQISRGANIKRLYAPITPGGGKSQLPVIAAEYLIPAVADKIAWLAPRRNLCRQAALDSFCDESLFSSNHRISWSGNRPVSTNPSHGTSGFVETYDAVRANPDLFLQELRRHRYILFLDEVHLIADDSVTYKYVQPLVDASVLSIFATGTKHRGDRHPIPFFPYKGRELDFASDPESALIEYSRADALAEGAIAPLDFRFFDGAVKFQRPFDDTVTDITSIAQEQRYRRQTLRTALETEYASEMMYDAVMDWQHHRLLYPQSKLLVIAQDQGFCRKHLDWLTSRNINAGVAISDDESAQQNIEQFKNGWLDALVTCQMVYMGMDVKEITHIVYLTNITNSEPWMEQALGRAVRIAEGKHFAYIWLPDHPDVIKTVENIRSENVPYVRAKEGELEQQTQEMLAQAGFEEQLDQFIADERAEIEADPASFFGDIPPDIDEEEMSLADLAINTEGRNREFLPISGTLGGLRSVNEKLGVSLDQITSKKVVDAMIAAGIPGGISAAQAYKAFKDFERQAQSQESPVIEDRPAPEVSPVVIRERLMGEIERRVRAYVAEQRRRGHADVTYHQVNRKLARRSRGKRNDLDIDKLREQYQWVILNLPIEGSNG